MFHLLIRIITLVIDDPSNPSAADLTADPAEFYRMAADVALPELPADTPPALEKLGPAPFPRNKFPFLGFLASVYDHVATHANQRSGTR